MKFGVMNIVAISLFLMTGCDKTPNSNGQKVESSATQTSSTSASSPDAGQQAASNSASGKKYVVATDSNYAPFANLDERGNPMGYDIDVIKAVAEKAGIQVDVIPVNWSEFPVALNNGKVDMWIAGISITDERKGVIDYSEPYLSYKTGVATKSDEKGNAINQSNLGSQRLVALSGTVNYDYAKSIASSPNNLKGVGTTFLGIKDIITGTSDAFINNDKVLQYYIKQHPEGGLRLFNIETGKGEINVGIAVKKGNAELVQKLNQGLNTIKQDGTYNKINEKWFGQ
ncbi:MULTISPECIES: transporter substrate-binding domain-containing protein [unclassified Acinetobacter]|uniref:ABC transporter substrate-binding protein n=1 Tax=unclassified Acinetobacter TaxID=196816 RepID=UPI0035BAA7CF